ncbi:hypothetical protein BDV29DRAFT_169631, partial [Aspergillus leporis]
MYRIHASWGLAYVYLPSFRRFIIHVDFYPTLFTFTVLNLLYVCIYVVQPHQVENQEEDQRDKEKGFLCIGV